MATKFAVNNYKNLWSIINLFGVSLCLWGFLFRLPSFHYTYYLGVLLADKCICMLIKALFDVLVWQECWLCVTEDEGGPVFCAVHSNVELFLFRDVVTMAEILQLSGQSVEISCIFLTVFLSWPFFMTNFHH